MAAAHDLAQIRPILTDADWSFEWEFFGADEGSPDNSVSVAGASLVFAPARVPQPAAGAVHEITFAGGGISFPAANLVSARLAAADLAAWTPGVYLVELRQVGPSTLREPLYVGSVTVARGLSQLATQGGGAGWPAQSRGGAKVYRDPSGVRVVRGAGSGAAAAAAQAALAAEAADISAASAAASVATIVDLLAFNAALKPLSGIYLNPDIVAPDAPVGTAIGVLFAGDPDPLNSFTWTMIDGLGGRFALAGDVLQISATGLAGDNNSMLTPRVRVVDQGGNAFETVVPVFVLSLGLLDGRLPSQTGLINSMGLL